MTEIKEMVRLQRRYNMIEGLYCDGIGLYDHKKKGFKPKYKWKDRKAHFAYKKKEKELFEKLPDSRFGDRIPPDGEVL